MSNILFQYVVSLYQFIVRRRVLFFAFTLSGLVTGCTTLQIEHQVVSHSRAITESFNRVLLANIIRASQDLPFDFTAMENYKGKESVSSRFSPSFPFGGDASSIFNFNPDITVSPGISSIDLRNIGQSKETFKVLHKPATKEDFERLFDSSWPHRLFQTFLFKRLTIRGEFEQEVFGQSNHLCRNTKELHPNLIPSCRSIERARNYCPAQVDVRRGFYTNNARNLCEFLVFQSVMSRLEVLRIQFDAREGLKPWLRDDSSRRGKRLKEIYEREEKRQSERSRHALELKTRSVHGMIQFLGNLARAQISGPAPWMPTLYMGPNSPQPTPMFIINPERMATNKPTISTRFGTRFYRIGGMDHGYGQEDWTMRLFSYVRVKLDEAYAETALPASNTFVIR